MHSCVCSSGMKNFAHFVVKRKMRLITELLDVFANVLIRTVFVKLLEEASRMRRETTPGNLKSSRFLSMYLMVL